MCGIAGFIINGEHRNSSAILKKMTDVISHRGPDDYGFFETTDKNAAYHVGLGHRRLSIIDLESGRQPICNEDGSVQIIFNGEIYNFIELRKTLINRGHSFTTGSDTETIIHAYEEYGVKCVDHLRGMFAFAIWDSKIEKLYRQARPMRVYEGASEVLRLGIARQLTEEVS